MSIEPQLQMERTADRLREEFLVTLRELDRRRHRAMDLRGLLREKRRVLLAAGGGIAALVVVIVGTRVALSRSRRARLARRRMQGRRRARSEDLSPAELLLGLLEVAVVAAGSQIAFRGAQRALPG